MTKCRAFGGSPQLTTYRALKKQRMPQLFGRKKEPSVRAWLDPFDGLDLDFIAIDFETANWERASACAVGIIGVKNRSVVASAQNLINPEIDFKNFNIAIHGITPEKVSSAPTFAQIWNGLGSVLHRQNIVAHNAAFDVQVIVKSAERYGLSVPDFQTHCTLSLSRRIWPQYPSHRLDYLCRREGIELAHHDALSDAMGCAQLYIRQLQIIQGEIVEDEMTDPFDQLFEGESLRGKVFCFTGELSEISRDEARELVEARCATFADHFTRSVTHLVVGSIIWEDFLNGFETIKIRKAKHDREAGYPIEVINEKGFFEMLRGSHT